MANNILDKARRGEVLKDIYIFDCHGHIGPSFVHHIPGHDADSMVQTMDRLGVDVMCISGEAGIGCDHCAGNDLVAEAIRTFPNRFIGYASINPNHAEETDEELNRCFRDLGLKAIKIHPTFHGYPADGPHYRAVWEFAAQEGCPVLAHTQGGDANATPKRFDSIAGQYPNVPIILGHAGNTLAGVEEAIGVAREHDNIYLDLNFSTYHYGLVEYLIDQVSIDKLVFGSDCSWNSLSYFLGIILYAKIGNGDKEKILGANGATLFSIERHR